jgi:hypothetical protein
MDSGLVGFRKYGYFVVDLYNTSRVHASRRQTPIPTAESKRVNLKYYGWQKHCCGLYETPIAA